MASAAVDDALVKPHVLVLGGLGFIGRNLVDYLVRNVVARKIVVADKVLPEMAWLSPMHKKSFEQITFQQIDLIKPNSVANLFASQGDNKFDYVFNCAGETKPWLPIAIYENGIYTLSVNCAKEAAMQNVKCFVELSCAELWSKGESTSRSSSPITNQKLRVERELSRIVGLNYIIARLVHVYGPSDVHGLTTCIIFGGLSRFLNEPLEMFWNSSRQYYTVHVQDVVRALIHLSFHCTPGKVYALADKSNTDQKLISDLVSKIFHIEHSFLGVMTTNFIKMNMDEALMEITEKYLPPWTELCSKEGIHSTPLYPHINEDIIHHMSYNLPEDCIPDFVYDRPNLTIELLMEVLEYYLDLRLFPRSLLP